MEVEPYSRAEWEKKILAKHQNYHLDVIMCAQKAIEVIALEHPNAVLHASRTI